MVSIRYRKDRRKWEIDWRDDGQRKRQHFSKKENADEFAKIKANELERKRAGLSSVDIIQFCLWADIFNKNHFKYLSKTYAKQALSVINNIFVPALGEMYMHEITRGTIKNYVDQKLAEGSSNKTVINHASLLRTMFDKAIEHKYAFENPCEGLVVPKNIARTTRKPVPLDQLTIFLRAADEELRKAVLILVNTGLRSSELIALTGSDIDVLNGFLTVRSEEGRTTKNYQARVVPIPPVIRDLLIHIKTNEPVIKSHKRTLESRFWRLREKLGFNWNMHELRHTYISRCLKAGIDKRTLREYTGHQGNEIIDRYSHFIPENLQAGVNIGAEFVRSESNLATIWSPQNKNSLQNNGFTVREGGLEPLSPNKINDLQNQSQVSEIVKKSPKSLKVQGK